MEVKGRESERVSTKSGERNNGLLEEERPRGGTRVVAYIIAGAAAELSGAL